MWQDVQHGWCGPGRHAHLVEIGEELLYIDPLIEVVRLWYPLARALRIKKVSQVIRTIRRERKRATAGAVSAARRVATWRAVLELVAAQPRVKSVKSVFSLPLCVANPTSHPGTSSVHQAIEFLDAKEAEPQSWAS